MPKPPTPRFALRQMLTEVGRALSWSRVYVRKNGQFEAIGYLVRISEWARMAGQPYLNKFVSDEELRANGWQG